MNTGKYLAIGIALTLIVIATLVCVRTNQFTNPSSLKMSDLEGVWVAHYASGMNDILTLKADGTFRQVFENSREKYVYDSGWNQWTLEELPKGIVRLHLKGGRYYLAGISFGENDGKIPCIGNDCTLEGWPRGFHDPFADEIVYMVDELLLVVQIDSTNGLILHHMWTSSDRGFLVIGGDREIFFRETNVTP